jgi:hypothetical protein
MFTLGKLLARLSARSQGGASSFAKPASTWTSRGVWGLWTIGFIWTAIFIARHGHNLPANDEWVFVPITYASWSEKIQWIGERHMEHRFPLARIAYLCLLEATGYDYRAGMWLTLGLLGASAATLILTARRLRGHTSMADSAYAFLFLHVGHSENLLMGYQIAFTITVLALSFFALLVAYSDTMSPSRAAACGSLCLVTIALGGWLGLVFVPTVGLWVAWQAWRGESGGARRVAFGLTSAVAAYLAWSSWMLLKFKASAASSNGLALADRIRSTAEVIAIGLGPGAGALYVKLQVVAWALIGIEAATACCLVWISWRRPEERAIAWGFLMLLLGVWVFAVAIGFSRAGGTSSRYAAFSALGIAVPFLTAARYARGMSVLAGFVAMVGGCLVFSANVKHGRSQAVLYDSRYASVAADVQSGMPIDVLARRHVDFWHSAPKGWKELWKHGFAALDGVPPTSGQKPTIRAVCRPDGQQAERHATFARHRVELSAEMPVSFVRVTFQAPAPVIWELMRFTWIDPRTGAKRESLVRPWISKGKQFTEFWIDGPLVSGELLMGREACPIEILSVECCLQSVH